MDNESAEKELRVNAIDGLATSIGALLINSHKLNPAYSTKLQGSLFTKYSESKMISVLSEDGINVEGHTRLLD